MLRLAFDFIITWRETRTRPNAYNKFSLFLCLYIQNELDLICNLFIIILQKRHFTYLT